MATTVTATSDVDNNFSDDEDNMMNDDSGTDSAPSPSPLPADDKGTGLLESIMSVRVG